MIWNDQTPLDRALAAIAGDSPYLKFLPDEIVADIEVALETAPDEHRAAVAEFLALAVSLRETDEL